MRKLNHRFIKPVVYFICLLAATTVFAELRITGEWAAQSKAGVMMTLHFFGDGIWEFDVNGDMVKDMWGKYKVKGETVTLTTSGGKELCASPKQSGSYIVQLNGPQLTFIEKSDACAARAENFSLFWTQQ